MKVVVTEFIWPEGMEVLERQAEVYYDPDLWKKPEELKLRVADVEGIIVRNQTKVSMGLLDVAPGLKVVVRLGIGPDNIDVAACKQRGISVLYARNADAVSVVEYVFAVMLTFSRKLDWATEDVKKGNWNRKHFTVSELYGKTLGIIGPW